MTEAEAVVRRFHAAYERGDWEETMRLQHPDAEFRPPPDFPGKGVYRGHDAIRTYFRQWIGTWDAYSWRALDYIVAGDRVAVLGHERGRGKGSGAETDQHSAVLHRVVDGLITDTQSLTSYEDALEALRG